MKAAIYCRVSTDDQEREGTSLQTQLEACVNYCQNKGYDAAYHFSETYSGLSLERPKLNELRELIRDEQIDVLVVYCLDRLSRDPTHGVILIQELEKYRVALESVTEDVDNSELGKLISYVRGFASKLEVEKIRERTARGIRQRVKAGRLPGGRATRLYGYDYVNGKGVGEGVRYINKTESGIAKEIYRLYVEEAMSINQIAHRLTQLQIPSPSGNASWHKSSVFYILSNQAYTGKTFVFTTARPEVNPHGKRKVSHFPLRPREEWVEVKGATPALITEDLFNQVQAKLKRNKELASRNTRREYLLSGHIFCENCGTLYHARTKEGKSYYWCKKCRGKYLNVVLIEKSVWQKIEEALENPEAVMIGLEALRNKRDREKAYLDELASLDAKLRHVAKEKDRVWKAFELTGDEEKFTCEIKAVTSASEELRSGRRNLSPRWSN